MRVLAMDIGGSSVKSGVAAAFDGGVAFEETMAPSRLASREFGELRQVVLGIAEEAFRAGPRVDAVGISTTGTVDEDGTVRSAGHFNGYKRISWKEILQPVTGPAVPVATLNDGRASAWAEYGRVRQSVSSFAHFVVGTGIGGGIVIDRKLLWGAQGAAAQLGHIKVAETSTVTCSCRKAGCVETLASAPAIARAWREHGAVGDLREAGFEEIAALASRGDERAARVITDAGRHLGYAVANVISILNPQVITIGGGVVAATEHIGDGAGGGPYVEAAAGTARELVFPRVAAQTQILPASYGNEGGLIGAALFSASSPAG